MLSLSAAAKRANVSKATIHRAIKSSKVFAVRQDDGSYQIDPAELARVYPSALNDKAGETPEAATKPVSDGSGKTSRNPRGDGVEASSSDAVLRAELHAARELVQVLREQVDDLKAERDAWRQQAEATQRLLASDKNALARPRSWWKRLAG